MFNIKHRYAAIAALTLYSYFNIRFTAGEQLPIQLISPVWILFAILGLIFGIWEFNRLAENLFQNDVPILHWRIHPLIIVFSISLIGVFVVSAGALYALSLLPDSPARFTLDNFRLLSVLGFRINLFLNCLNAIVFYMSRVKTIEVQAEALKKITVEAQFEALRNQINPHFLFNCFNVLSSLVYRDADTAAKFIGQLSQVYRYLLYSQEKKIVPLKEEMDFIESYLYLLKIRFGDNILFRNDLTTDSLSEYVAPAVMQLLIENAIKHNVISRKTPLSISIVSDSDSIWVVNTLQEKQIKEPSNHLGLQNIERRYKFLSDQPITIQKTSSEFRVKIPLLKIEAS
jgi:two-component system LytT family sensor kinase